MPTAQAQPDWIAPGRSTVSAFVIAEDAMPIAQFAMEVFGATAIRPPLYRSSGALWNYELTIGESTIMFADGEGAMIRPAFLYIHVPDAATTYQAALAAGATPVMPPADQFYGDYDGGVEDMAGNWWWIGTHRKTLTPDDIEAAARIQETKT